MVKKTAAAVAALVVLVALAGCGGVSKKKPTDPVEFAATWLTAVINYDKGGNCDIVMDWMTAHGKKLMASDGPGCAGVYHSINPETADWAGVKKGTDATKDGNCHTEGKTPDQLASVVCFDKISIGVVGTKDDLMSDGYTLY